MSLTSTNKAFDMLRSEREISVGKQSNAALYTFTYEIISLSLDTLAHLNMKFILTKYDVLHFLEVLTK